MAPSAVRFRVRVIGLPPSASGGVFKVALGIQRGEEIEQSRPMSDEPLEFSGEIRLKDRVAGAAPVFLGPFAHGPPGGRFLYLSWTGLENEKCVRFGRIKVPLGGITWDQVEEAQRTGGSLVVSIAGRGKGGGPAFATVPLLGSGWGVEQG